MVRSRANQWELKGRDRSVRQIVDRLCLSAIKPGFMGYVLSPPFDTHIREGNKIVLRVHWIVGK